MKGGNIMTLLILHVSIRFTEEIKWVTQPRTINVCIGHDVDLQWRFDDVENATSSLEWYFNNKMICTSSDSENFTVSPPYQDRIQRLSKTDIRLKNISLDDEGIFILFHLPEWSTSQNMQNISLQVLLPPTNKCTCKSNCVVRPSKPTCESTIPDCGRPQVTAAWKQNETLEPLGKENYHQISSSSHDTELLCCLAGPAMKCVTDPQQFCTPVKLYDRDEESSSKHGRSTLPTDSETTRGIAVGSSERHHGDTASSSFYNGQRCVILISSLTVSSLALLFSFLTFIITCRLRNSNKNLVAKIGKIEKTLLMEPTVNYESIPLLEIRPERHQDVRPLQVTEKSFRPLQPNPEQNTDVKHDQVQPGLYPSLAINLGTV